MTTSTPYAPACMAREARVQMRRMRRRACRSEAIVRAAVLAAVLATLAVGLTGAMRNGAEQVASSLDGATRVASAR